MLWSLVYTLLHVDLVKSRDNSSLGLLRWESIIVWLLRPGAPIRTFSPPQPRVCERFIDLILGPKPRRIYVENQV